MSTSSHIPESLALLHARTEEDRARVREELERRMGEPPRVGEIFTFPETASSGIAWAVIGDDGDERFLVVAADLEPFVGSADVEVGDNSSWVLRSRFELRLIAADFERARRAALLEPGVVARVLEKRDSLCPPDSPEEAETDRETGYQDHLEELARAREALTGQKGSERMEGQQLSGAEMPRLVRKRQFGNVYALAASVFLAVLLGVLALSQQQKIARLEAEREKPVAGLRYAVFNSLGGERGNEATVARASESSPLLLILQVNEDYPLYELEIRTQEAGTVAWRGELKAVEADLTVLLPRSVLPDGRYRLRLAGLRDGKTEELCEFRLQVTSTEESFRILE